MMTVQPVDSDVPTVVQNASYDAYDYYNEDYLEYDYFDIEDRVQYFMTQPYVIIAMLLGIVGIIANTLSLLAVCKTGGQMRSHFRLIQSLTISDVLICLSVVLHFTNHVFNPVYQPGSGPEAPRRRSRCIFMVIKALNNIALNSTLLNLMAMAIDHYIAIFRPLHYGRLMSKKRTITMILILWTVSVVCGFSDFLSAYPLYMQSHGHSYNYCEFVLITTYQEEFIVFAIAIICLAVMMFLYIRIYAEVRRQQMRDAYYHEIHPNKKAFITTLLILGTFVLCWLPTCLYQIVMIIQVKTNVEWVVRSVHILREIDKYLYDLMLLNTFFDPVIYAVRMREIRVGYRQLFNCCRQKPRPRPSLSCDNSYFTLIGDMEKTPRGSVQMSNGRHHRLDRSNSAGSSAFGFRRDSSRLSNGYMPHGTLTSSHSAPNGHCEVSILEPMMEQTSTGDETKV